MYAISTLLFLVAEKASRVHKLTYYISSIFERLLKLSAVSRVTQLRRPHVGTRGNDRLITVHALHALPCYRAKPNVTVVVNVVRLLYDGSTV